MSVNKKTMLLEGANFLRVEAGTNCPQGGDYGHGGRTHLKLTDEGSTAMEVSVDGEPLRFVDNIEIVLGGDSEGQMFVEALEFALDVIRAQRLLNTTDNAKS